MPSLAHGALHMTAAFLLAASDLRRPGMGRIVGPIAYGTAGLVGLVRMYQNDHWASDLPLANGNRNMERPHRSCPIPSEIRQAIGHADQRSYSAGRDAPVDNSRAGRAGRPRCRPGVVDTAGAG
jgi:hypothetical protein